MKIRKSGLPALLIILFPVCASLGGPLEYYDEAMAVAAFVWLWVMFLRGRLSGISRLFVLLLTLITAIGLISNGFSGLIDQSFPVLVDVLWLWKPFACCIFFSTVCVDEEARKQIISMLQIPAKLTVFILLGTALVGQFLDIGVTVGPRTGLFRTFGFFWRNAIQTGWLAFSCILVLAMSPISDKSFRRYLFMASVPLLMTGSSLVYCWVFVIVALMFLVRKNAVFKKRYIVALAVGVILFAMADIQTYFSADKASVRKTMIEGGIHVANTYFPLGSGFATYGSEMASRYYSKLYIMFGWENTWALGRKGLFLNDNFYASIVAQFGWFGFALYLTALYFLFKTVNTKLVDKRIRVSAIATVITIAVVMIGSASAKSMMGVFTFSVLGVVCGMIESARRESAVRPEGKDKVAFQ